MKTVKKIFVAAGEKKAIKLLLKTTFPTVREALNGKETTKLHVQIRTLAIERGGIEKPTIDTTENEKHEKCDVCGDERITE